MEIKSRVPGKIVRFVKQLVPSPVAGVVKEYKVQPGDRVSAGQVVAIVE